MPASRSYRWVILAIVFLAQLSISLSSLSVAPLAPLIQSELSLSKAQLGLFSAASSAGTIVVVLWAGALTDLHGARRLMCLGQVVIALFMVGIAFAGSFSQAILVMLGVGIGCGVLPPGLSKSVTTWFPRTSRGLAMGLKQSGVPVGGMIAASILPVVGLTLGWRATLALVGVWIMGAAIVTVLFCRDDYRPETDDERGSGMLAGMRSVIGNRSLWCLSTVSLLYVTVQMATLTYLALFLTEVVLVQVIPDEGPRIIAAGGYLALCQAGGALGRIFWGVVSDRFFHGRRMPVLAIIGALSAISSAVIANLESGFPLWLLAVLLIFSGATVVGWNGLYQACITENVDRRHTGTGVGFSMTLSQLGAVAGPPLFGFIVDTSGSFRGAWLLLVCLCVCGLAMSLLNSTTENGVA